MMPFTPPWNSAALAAWARGSRVSELGAWGRASALRGWGKTSGVHSVIFAASVLAVLTAGWPAAAGAQMPDPRAMSGKSMPTSDLPAGTVTVRVVRDQITNNLSGVPVELHGAGDVRRATTGSDGRAQFDGIAPGSEVHAVAVVDGRRMESEPFAMPSAGGVRTLLVATSEAAAAGGAAPAQGGTGPSTRPQPSGSVSSLAIGGNSRIAAEFSDDVLQVFYLFEIVNRTAAAVTPASAVIFEMPTGAEGTTVLEGSTKNASAKGRRVTVSGPFQPGVTPLQIGFRLESLGSAAAITATFPLPMDTVSVAVQKIGSMTVNSPQLARRQEMPIDTSLFVVGMGPRLAPGSPLILQLENLPHRSRTPVYVALGLAAAIVGAAVWFVAFPGQFEAAGARRRALHERRENGLAALAALDAEYRAERIDADAYAARRATLVAQLERVYGELDQEGGTPPGGQGIAA
jgi:hypothetical protein